MAFLRSASMYGSGDNAENRALYLLDEGLPRFPNQGEGIAGARRSRRDAHSGWRMTRMGVTGVAALN